jgi:hypothetical protein
MLFFTKKGVVSLVSISLLIFISIGFFIGVQQWFYQFSNLEKEGLDNYENIEFISLKNTSSGYNLTIKHNGNYPSEIYAIFINSTQCTVSTSQLLPEITQEITLTLCGNYQIGKPYPIQLITKKNTFRQTLLLE